MNAVRGRVRDGHVEIESSLPEGAEVLVLAGGNEEAPFELEEAQIVELETRLLERNRGSGEPAEALLARLRATRP